MKSVCIFCRGHATISIRTRIIDCIDREHSYPLKAYFNIFFGFNVEKYAPREDLEICQSCNNLVLHATVLKLKLFPALFQDQCPIETVNQNWGRIARVEVAQITPNESVFKFYQRLMNEDEESVQLSNSEKSMPILNDNDAMHIENVHSEFNACSDGESSTSLEPLIRPTHPLNGNRLHNTNTQREISTSITCLSCNPSTQKAIFEWLQESSRSSPTTEFNSGDGTHDPPRTRYGLHYITWPSLKTCSSPSTPKSRSTRRRSSMSDGNTDNLSQGGSRPPSPSDSEYSTGSRTSRPGSGKKRSLKPIIKLICSSCNAETSTREELALHKRTVHALNYAFSCDICCEQFVDIQDNTQHYEECHATALKCRLCPMIYKTSKNLMDHWKSSHVNTCIWCKSSYSGTELHDRTCGSRKKYRDMLFSEDFDK